MRRVIVLRPEPGASATVERARQRGLAALALPLFEIEPLPWDAPDPRAFDALLLTSANAARCAGEGLRKLSGLPVHAVGEATAEAAREAGLAVATTGHGGVDGLLATIAPGQRLLHLCGADRKPPANARQTIIAVAVYRSREKAFVDVTKLAGSVALIHSPRAGRRFAELTGNHSRIAIAAISAEAAEAAGTGWEIVETAAEPTGDALLALAAQLCNKPPSR